MEKVYMGKSCILHQELKRLKGSFDKLNADRKVFAKLDTMSEFQNFLYLSVKKENGLFRFDSVLSNVYPVVAGGDEHNTYDILINLNLIDPDNPLVSLLKDSLAISGLRSGKIYGIEKMEPHMNHIVDFNESYSPIMHLLIH